jgi:hypothetical protein
MPDLQQYSMTDAATTRDLTGWALFGTNHGPRRCALRAYGALRSPETSEPLIGLQRTGAHGGTATGIRTRVSGLRIRRPSPLDDSGAEARF